MHALSAAREPGFAITVQGRRKGPSELHGDPEQPTPALIRLAADPQALFRANHEIRAEVWPQGLAILGRCA
jgi:hypothetical protein